MSDGRGESWDYELELAQIDEACMKPYERIEALREWANAAVYEMNAHNAPPSNKSEVS